MAWVDVVKGCIREGGLNIIRRANVLNKNDR